MYGGSQESTKRPGTQNVPGAVGMAQALYDCVRMQQEYNKKLEMLRSRLLDNLNDIEGIWVNGHSIKRVPGIINLGFHNVSGETLMLLLDFHGISVSTGSSCNTHSVEPSHVLTAMGLSEDRARSCIRISLSANNSLEEMDEISNVLKQEVERIRDAN